MNNLVTKVGTIATRNLGKLSLALRSKSPEILIGAGICLVVGGTIMACKATSKAKDILYDREIEIRNLEEEESYNLSHNGYDPSDSSKDDEFAKGERRHTKKEKALVNITCGRRLVKCYAPSFAFEVAGIACFLGAHGIMRRRNSALIAAYEATEAAYRRLQEKVKRDNDSKSDLEEAKNRVANGSGDIVDEIETSDRVYKENEQFNQYSFFFDEMCDAWKGDAELNLTFARMVENVLTKRLQARGFVFLNEVREMFGMDSPGPTAQGQIIEWMTKLGDTCVDLGIRNGYQEGVRSFVNGRDRSVLLTPNCYHVIYNKL